MGLYALHKFMFDVYSNAAVKQEFLTDPEAVYRRYALSQEELEALRNKDIYRLYKLGVNAYLLAPFAQLLGFQLAEFGNLLRAGAQAEQQQRSS
jgi:hypothetical protein